MLSLLWQLTVLSVWPVVLVVLVAIGMFIALFAWDRLTAHEWKRADRLVSEAERGPANVIYLTDQIRVDHRERRLLRLLERG